jgi:hypothetical protein
MSILFSNVQPHTKLKKELLYTAPLPNLFYGITSLQARYCLQSSNQEKPFQGQSLRW